MITRSRLGAAGVAICALAVTGVSAGAASAATLTANAACYVQVPLQNKAAVTLVGQGYTPGDSIDVHDPGDDFFAATTVAADGTFSLTAQAPILPTIDPAVKSYTLSAFDETTATGIPLAQATIDVANLAVATKPSSVRSISRTKVAFSFSGFTPGREIYAFYARGRRIVARARFGRAAGPCGTLTHRALEYPGGHPSGGSYHVTFESTGHYSRTALPRVTATLTILRF